MCNHEYLLSESISVALFFLLLNENCLREKTVSDEKKTKASKACGKRETNELSTRKRKRNRNAVGWWTSPRIWKVWTWWWMRRKHQAIEEISTMNLSSSEITHKSMESERKMKSEISIAFISSTFKSKPICYINQLLPTNSLLVSFCCFTVSNNISIISRMNPQWVDLRLAHTYLRVHAITSDHSLTGFLFYVLERLKRYPVAFLRTTWFCVNVLLSN